MPTKDNNTIKYNQGGKSIKLPFDYHDLYVQSDTLLLADVFENFRKACIETYELDPAYYISLPGLA